MMETNPFCEAASSTGTLSYVSTAVLFVVFRSLLTRLRLLHSRHAMISQYTTFT